MYTEKTYWNARYANGSTSGCGSEGIEAEWKREVIRTLIDVHKVESILDIGCGDGQLMFPILSEYSGLTYVGLDIAKSIVDKHSSNPPPSSSKVSFECVDICSDQKPRQSFDMVLMMDVLFHVSTDSRHALMLQKFFSSFNKVGILSLWNENMENVQHAAHCFHRPVHIPEGFSFCTLPVPNVNVKDLAIITHNLGDWSLDESCYYTTNRNSYEN